MNTQTILNKLQQAKKGRYINLSKVKDLGNGITKESDMVIRLGVNYANMSINEGRQTGSLPWGHWVEGLENLVIEHKGNYYLRVTAIDPEHLGNGAEIIATRYIKDNEEISKQEALAIVGEKKMASHPSSVYNIKFTNIVRLGN